MKNLATGLTTEAAQQKLKEFGPNLLPQARPVTNFEIVVRSLREPIIFLLVSCGILYLFLGEVADGVILFGSILVVVGITFYQERKSERALEALRSLASPRALVIRDGKSQRVAGQDVVPGDILLLSEGDRVPADAIVRSSINLRVDESLLTGESFPVSKPGDAQVYSGTLVIGGRATAEVMATGARTELGKIGKSLEEPSEGRTRLESAISKLIQVFAIAGIGASVLIIVIYGLTRGDWVRACLVGLSAAISLLPEEFAVVLAIFLATGAWRLSKRNVLIRKMSSTEALGSVTVLCVDKTGTLTLNQMSLCELQVDGALFQISNNGSPALPEKFHPLVEYGALASHIDPFDPMEQAIVKTLNSLLGDTEHVHRDWQMVKEYPLSQELLAMSCVWRSRHDQVYTVAAKGAPEAIFDLCHFDKGRTEALLEEVRAMADRGLRILAVARGKFPQSQLPEGQHAFDFEYLGLLGMEDPVRSGVPEAISKCYKAGVRVIMMTGDYAGTAIQIARKIGLKNPDSVILGSDLAGMTDEELQEKIKCTDVFVRMVPDHKLRIVKALKAVGEVVAMTGDGINDAPSLKAADIGVAMGKRGTDVAREAAGVVLLDDNFASLVEGIGQGRKIYDNIRKAVFFILTVHVPIAGLAILPVLFGMPLALLAPQIVFLELIIDPTCTFVFDAEEEDSENMRRPPRPLGRPLITTGETVLASARGLIVLAAVFASYLYLLRFGKSATEARTFAFAALILSNLGLIRSSRETLDRSANRLKQNIPFAWVSILSIFLLFLAVYFEPLQRIFDFSSLPLHESLLVLGVAMGTYVLNFLLKVIRGTFFAVRKRHT